VSRSGRSLAAGWRPAALAFALALPGCRSAPAPEPWHELFDGESLAGWAATEFGGEGEVAVREGRIVLAAGSPLTGIHRTGEVPVGRYEIELCASRLAGNDFFVGLTFPFGSEHLTLVLGGWGGAVCGLSSIDGADAAHNRTRVVRAFRQDQPYVVHVRVRPPRITATIDGALLVDCDLSGSQVGLRPEVLLSRPLGVACYATSTALHTIRWRQCP
jgi:hypothetical protein